MTEKFNLTWHTFETHTNELLSELYRTSNFSDVTLICDDQSPFKAHKFVLSACSSVFRNILSNDVTSPFIYLRGIAKDEVKSLLQFMYLGEASFYQERMNEFLKVANDLDIKEIGQNDGLLDNQDLNKHYNNLAENEPIEDGSDISNSDPTEKNVYSSNNHTDMTENIEGRFPCDLCNKTYNVKKSLTRHKQTHEGVRYPCNQCDYKATLSSNLITHIKSQHEGVRYPCQHCDYKATTSSHLNTHIRQKH